MLLFLLFSAVTASNPWDKYNLSPATRDLSPVGVVGRSGPVFPLILQKGEYAVLDFGKEVGGFTTVSFGAVSANASVGLAYSESTNYASCPSTAVGACQDGQGQVGAGDHSNGGDGPDGILEFWNVKSFTNYTPTLSQMRGGFRYLNLFMLNGDNVNITNVNLHFSPAPLMTVPNDYPNHFYSSDELLNRIWYACAYTVQMCTIDSSQGRQWGPPAAGWNNAVLVGAGKSLLVDGAKRDRTIWPGDMGISTATAFVTIGDTISSINSLNTLYALQKASDTNVGQLPYVGPEVFCQKPWGEDCQGQGSWNSDTYHLWALVGTANLVHYTSDLTWLSQIWKGYKAGLQASLNKINGDGLMVITAEADWQRSGQGDENIAGNALLAHNLWEGAKLAVLMNDTAAQQKYSAAAQSIQAAINAKLWSDRQGCFLDNPHSSLCPQDGNSLMLWFNLTTAERKANVSTYLVNNWVPLGAVSPEWVYQGGKAIGTFPGSMEVLGHLAAGQSDNGLELIRRQWGYMLLNKNSTESTFWEGYQANGQFAFEGIYMSHAHGWATGPAPALTFYVLGLQRIANKFRFVPQFPSTLEFCEGSLSLGVQGTVKASWRRFGSKWEATLDLRNASTSGDVGLPLSDSLFVDSIQARVNGELTDEGKRLGVRMEADRLWLQVSAPAQIALQWH